MHKHHEGTRRRLPHLARVVVALGLIGSGASALHAAQTDITGPPGSLRFGSNVAVLANGNFVVVDGDGPVSGVGSVHLHDINGSLISTLTGSSANDHIGSGGIVVLQGGEAFVVVSPFWDNAGKADAGAVTWMDGSTGLNGTVTAANSLVGTSVFDYVGISGVAALSNGNYVVASGNWDNGTTAEVGAVTWGNGAGGSTGPVSSANSLVGTSAGDQVGTSGVTALSNGNYVVASPYWDNGGTEDVGAATRGIGTGVTAGPVSSANSLVGTSASDQVGSSGVTALSNGHYVVASPYWDNGGTANVGAVTWGNGTAGSAGPVSSANSLVGTSADDYVGGSVTALSNDDYVVSSPEWDNGATGSAGAVTWGNGATGISGPVSSANSLVGTSQQDNVGFPGVTALSNGNYVVASRFWDNGVAANVGAATWCRAGGGTIGPVTAISSLIGTQTEDRVGYFDATAYPDGNYIVKSSTWDNGGISSAGAITLASSHFRLTGQIEPWNSVLGGVAHSGPIMAYAYDPVRHRLIVGRPAENIVSLFTMDQIFADGVEP